MVGGGYILCGKIGEVWFRHFLVERLKFTLGSRAGHGIDRRQWMGFEPERACCGGWFNSDFAPPRSFAVANAPRLGEGENGFIDRIYGFGARRTTRADTAKFTRWPSCKFARATQ